MSGGSSKNVSFAQANPNCVKCKAVPEVSTLMSFHHNPSILLAYCLHCRLQGLCTPWTGQLLHACCFRLGDSLTLPAVAAARKPVDHEMNILIKGAGGVLAHCLLTLAAASVLGLWEACSSLLECSVLQAFCSKFWVLTSCPRNYHIQPSKLDTLEKTVQMMRCVDMNYSLLY